MFSFYYRKQNLRIFVHTDFFFFLMSLLLLQNQSSSWLQGWHSHTQDVRQTAAFSAGRPSSPSSWAPAAQ